MTCNYEGKILQDVSVEIITGNYQLVYYVAEKCGNYRDTGVSKKDNKYILVLYKLASIYILCLYQKKYFLIFI